MRRTVLTLALSLLLLAPSANAATKTAKLVSAAYSKAGGVVPPCMFTAAQLKQALKEIGPDADQYSPDFRDAINQALEQRAAGVCDKKKSTAKTTTSAAVAPVTTTSGGATPPAQQATTSTAAQGTDAPAATTDAAATPVTTPSSITPQPDPALSPAPAVSDDAIQAAARTSATDGADDTPAPLLVLALMLGALLVLAALWSAVSWFGFDPPWLVRWRHASQEAGWRASAAWSEFTDWVRLGR